MSRGRLERLAYIDATFNYVISAFFILLGVAAIIYGIYFGESEMIGLGISVIISYGIYFLIFRFLLGDQHDPEETQRMSESIGQPSASSVFGARVYEIPDRKCKNCGGHIFDIYSDDSGKCSKCEEYFVNFKPPESAKLLGLRQKDGSID